MNFDKTLISGEFIKRYKRFFVDIKIGNSIITAHCPNTGSMMGLLDKGNDVWLTKNDDPKRKLKFTLEIIKVKNNLTIGNFTNTNTMFLYDSVEMLNNQNLKDQVSKIENLDENKNK